MRLEDFLFARFHSLSRMYLREVVRDEGCEVNGRHENVGHRLRGDDFIEIEVDLTRGSAMQGEQVDLDIVFEDAHLIVVDKPAGMLVHPTHRDKNGTLLNALVFYLNRNDLYAEGRTQSAESPLSEFVVSPRAESGSNSPPEFTGPRSAFIRPGLVHRLDKQTSGLMIIAKTPRIHRLLAKQFQRKIVEKKYLALVDGSVERDEGMIEGTIGRYAEEKRWGLKDDGKHSETRYRVLRRDADTTMLELEPVTGRTNQLRIHCASIGHPIVGDVARGGSEFERLCLHAWRLSFRHPISNSMHHFERRLEFLLHTDPTTE